MAPEKAAELHLVRFTTSRLRPLKPTPPNGPLPRLANHSGLSFIGKAAPRQFCRRQSLRQMLSRRPASAFIPTIRRPFRGHRITMAVVKIHPSQAVAIAASITSAAARSECALPGKIDKSALALSEPKRRRDKSHLRFVASQPCLVCGRHPSDPHHLRFAQPRALGVKVSDEFTVPLCRGHHRAAPSDRQRSCVVGRPQDRRPLPCPAALGANASQ